MGRRMGGCGFVGCGLREKEEVDNREGTVGKIYKSMENRKDIWMLDQCISVRLSESEVRKEL